MFAAQTGHTLLQPSPCRPLPCSYLAKDEIILKELFGDNHKTLKTNKGEIEVGAQKCVIWDLLSVLLSWNGQKPTVSDNYTIRLNDDSLLLQSGRTFHKRLDVDELYIFDPEAISGIGEYIEYKIERPKLTFDWLKFSSQDGRGLDAYFRDDNEFVCVVYFGKHKLSYTSQALAISHLNKEKLNHPEYTRIFSRVVLNQEFPDIEFKSESRNFRTQNIYQTKDKNGVFFPEDVKLISVNDLTSPLQKHLSLLQSDRGVFTGYIS